MPELPEVETYARDLSRVLRGRTITGARVGWPRQVPRQAPGALDRRIAGQTVRSVGRRGKYLVIALDADTLLIHLKMSGRLQIAPSSAPPDRHAHVVFGLDGGDELRFHDPRKFGRVHLVADPGDVVGTLGPEPLSPELTAERFAARLRARHGRLKPLLLDQTFLAGLGNIYVDESLWSAGLHPLRAARTLDAVEAARLLGAVRDVLTRAVAARGSSLSRGGFRDLTGRMGEMQGTLAVFRRTGEACPRCGSAIERLVVGGRGTHLCPVCQVRP